MSDATAIYLCTYKEEVCIRPNDSGCTEDFSGASVSEEFTKPLSGSTAQGSFTKVLPGDVGREGLTKVLSGDVGREEFTKALPGDAERSDCTCTGTFTIDGQRQLLRHYVEANLEPGARILEYVDENYSGSLYQRPSFLRMIEDAKKSVFQILLFWDTTRLATDETVADEYLKRVFPLLGIRVIIADSAYDSDRSGRRAASAGAASPTIEPGGTKSEIGYAFTPSAADADYYRREHSRKIRAGIQAKWEQGQNTAGHPPYGYRKDKTARGGWAIDPEAAQVVRQIFEKAGEGMQVKDIAAFLNGQGIAPPSVYREQKDAISRGATNCEASNREALNREANNCEATNCDVSSGEEFPGEELPGEELSGESPASKVTARAGNRKISASEQLWDNEKIRAILTRYAYTGADVHHPYSQSGGRISGDFGRSESEAGRKVIENAHDAIVTKAQYEKAQSQRQRRRGCRKRSSAQYAFKGKVRCGVCRLAMSRIHQAGGDAFYCSHRKYIGTHSACCSEYIPVTLIEQAARQQLREWQQEQDQPFDEMIEPYIETVYIYSADRIEVIFKPH